MSSPGSRIVILLLVLSLGASGCTHTIVQIRPPYAQKLRAGDGVKITVADGTILSGRVIHVDRMSIVVRTPKQTITENPVKAARFATTIRWADVRTVKVAGTLDSQGKFVSSEEIRVNRRSNYRRNLAINFGLLGLAGSFLVASAIQNAVSPSNTDTSTGNHGLGRFAFWATWGLGTAGSGLAGYQLGHHMDRNRALGRIERQRTAHLDSLQASGTEAIRGPR
jgi:hypothetical protein